MAFEAKRWVRIVAVAVTLASASGPAFAVAARFTPAETQQVDDLASLLVQAALGGRAAPRHLSIDLQAQHLRRALEDVVIRSGATPAVAQAAMQAARARLAGQGVSTECPPREVDLERRCPGGGPVALAFIGVYDAVSAQAQAGVSSLQPLTGPLAIAAPPSFNAGGGTTVYTPGPRR